MRSPTDGSGPAFLIRRAAYTAPTLKAGLAPTWGIVFGVGNGPSQQFSGALDLANAATP
jgi:hypothetical protein